jgi:hypothetical protein
MGGGRTVPDVPPNGGGDGSGGLVGQILSLLQKLFGIGRSTPSIDTVALTTGATFQQMFGGSKKVMKAIIQNISTENVTITSINQNQVAGTGILLNAASASGEGGGSLPVSNVDLALLYFVRTTAGLTLAVYSES